MTKIAGIVLRAKDRGKTAEFYRELGLITNEHSHGGPLHHEVSPVSDEFVLEIYKKSDMAKKFTQDAIMIEVDSLDDALKVVGKFHRSLNSEIFTSGDMTFVYVTDPDDRMVLLMEKS